MNVFRTMSPQKILPSGWKLPTHDWLKTTPITYVPDHVTPVIRSFSENLLETFAAHGHQVTEKVNSDTLGILTASEFGADVNWRSSLMFTARRKFRLPIQPTVFTILHATPQQLEHTISLFSVALEADEPDPALFDFPGLTDRAYRTLFEQGKRGGPIMALARLLQSQSKCIRIILLVGETQPDYAYIFDLVGAHPKISAADPDFFYKEIMLRIVTALSTSDITDHIVEAPPIPRAVWDGLAEPKQMQAAAAALGRRKFFTEMVMIANLVHVPSISASVADQYSEGCFATWSPGINGLVATITGSARPVEKDAITEADLAVIVGVRNNGAGARVRHVEAKANDAPSSESVEMMEMDAYLPKILLGADWDIRTKVPVVRSKLHGHRGVSTYDPALVEFVPLEDAYYHYPVSCATEAQASAIVRAFSRSEALQNPDDPRQAVFTILPGHGLMLVEKWVPGKAAFQHLYELMDLGGITIDSKIPQGPFVYRANPAGFKEISF